MTNDRRNMNTYICFYNKRQWQCEAANSYQAQQLAAAHFKCKGYKIEVVLVAIDGKEVTHTPMM